MPQLKSLSGKIADYACTSFVELRETTAITAGVSNVIYFNVEFAVFGMGGKSETKKFPLCVCENLRFPSPFKNMRKFLGLAFSKDYFVTVMYDDEREIFILKADGKHYRTKVAVSVVLHKRNPFLNRRRNGPPPLNIRLPPQPLPPQPPQNLQPPQPPQQRIIQPNLRNPNPPQKLHPNQVPPPPPSTDQKK